MADIKKDLKYTKEHEWVNIDGNAVKIGISDYAQENLGDIVFVEMPEAGNQVTKGDTIASIESVKAVSDVYAPVSGKITVVNEEISSTPEIINQQPYDKGFICVIEAENITESDNLMNSDQYEDYLKTLDQ